MSNSLLFTVRLSDKGRAGKGCLTNYNHDRRQPEKDLVVYW